MERSEIRVGCPGFRIRLADAPSGLLICIFARRRRTEFHQRLRAIVIELAGLRKARQAELEDFFRDLVRLVELGRIFARPRPGAHAGSDPPRVQEVYPHPGRLGLARGAPREPPPPPPRSPATA